MNGKQARLLRKVAKLYPKETKRAMYNHWKSLKHLEKHSIGWQYRDTIKIGLKKSLTSSDKGNEGQL